VVCRRDSEQIEQAGARSRLRRVRPSAVAASALLLAVASCAPSSETVSESELEGTFERIVDESFLYTDELATAADLVPPTADDPYWRIVGSVFDPVNSRTQATVWESGNATNWERQDLPPAERARSEQIRAVTRAGDNLLAVGSSGLGEDSDAVVWRSTGGEGASWERPSPPTQPAGC
jgi:hypothetical protein